MKKLLAIFFAMSIFLCSCKQESKPLSSTQIMMDTVVTITVYDSNQEVLNGAIALCKEYDALFNRYNENSDIYRINSSKGKAVSVSPETREIIDIAASVSEKSDGMFDITVAALVDLWDVMNATTAPKKEEIDAHLNRVDYKKVKLDGTTVTLPQDMSIDLGGIAKGYIADKIKAYLQENGVTKAVINLGGNVMVMGQEGTLPYSVQVQKPFGKAGESVLTLIINNKTAVTSGVYQRYFEENGKLYHHIIDTKTGHPTDNGIYSVTVIADSSAKADALSTACLSLGIEKGTELAKLFGAETVFYDKDGKIYLSPGLKADYTTTPPTVKLVEQ